MISSILREVGNPDGSGGPWLTVIRALALRNPLDSPTHCSNSTFLLTRTTYLGVLRPAAHLLGSPLTSFSTAHLPTYLDPYFERQAHMSKKQNEMTPNRSDSGISFCKFIMR